MSQYLSAAEMAVITGIAERLEHEAAREQAWSFRSTEWPHHRKDYARAAVEMRAQARALRAALRVSDRSPQGEDREAG